MTRDAYLASFFRFPQSVISGLGVHRTMYLLNSDIISLAKIIKDQAKFADNAQPLWAHYSFLHLVCIYKRVYYFL